MTTTTVEIFLEKSIEEMVNNRINEVKAELEEKISKVGGLYSSILREMYGLRTKYDGLRVRCDDINNRLLEVKSGVGHTNEVKDEFEKSIRITDESVERAHRLIGGLRAKYDVQNSEMKSLWASHNVLVEKVNALEDSKNKVEWVIPPDVTQGRRGEEVNSRPHTHLGKPWTCEMDKYLRRQFTNFIRITGKAMGRTNGGIKERVRSLGLLHDIFND